MALLHIIQDEEASPEALALFDHSRRLFGRVANAIRIAAHTPRIAQVLFGFIVASSREEISGNLDLRTKTLVIIKTSMLNGCNYCVGHNTTLGRTFGLTDDQIEALEGDHRSSDLFSSAEKAALTWAEHLTKITYRQHPEAMVELKKHFNEPQIVEITMSSGFYNFWNRYCDSLQIDVENKEVADLYKKSAQVDPADYVRFMRDCWWREGGEEARLPNEQAGAEANVPK